MERIKRYLRSAAGYQAVCAKWLVLAALGQGITVTGLRQDSRQGDRRALTLCRELPRQVSLRENPDLLPPLALLAALRPDKEMRFTDAARLRHKESDRLAATAALLTALPSVVWRVFRAARCRAPEIIGWLCWRPAPPPSAGSRWCCGERTAPPNPTRPSGGTMPNWVERWNT